MKYVVWGLGVRGKLAVDFLKIDNIAAFIDLDPKFANTIYLGRKVIDFDTYLKNYQQYMLVITPKHDNDIMEMVEKAQLIQVVHLNDILY